MSTIFAFFIIPMIIAVLISYSQIISLFKENIKNSFFFLFGFIFYIIIHLQKNKPKILNYIYIFAHELTHALVGILTGNRVRKIKINSKYGYVSFENKVNKITAIAPYIIPFYNFVIAILYLFFYKTNTSLHVFLLFNGFFLSFHILNTIDSITINQRDFKESGGRFIATILIILLNIFLTAVIIQLLISEEKKNIEVFIKNCITYYILILDKVFYFLKVILIKLFFYFKHVFQNF